jgi:hypothetical protein
MCCIYDPSTSFNKGQPRERALPLNVGNLIIYFQQGARILARPAHVQLTKDSCLPFGSFNTIWEFELVEKWRQDNGAYLMICNTGG